MKTVKHIPQRMCIGCRIKKPKSEFIRIVKDIDKIKIDETQKEKGRGAYICKNRDCFDRIIKKKSLNKALKSPIPEDIINKLKDLIDE